MTPPLLVVDGPSLLYRSFFALPDSIRDGEGRPVNALLGATNALLRIVADRRPRAVVVCFGREAAAYRVERYPPYHADRPEVPDALAAQLDDAPAFFAAFGWASATHAELEADDLLHAYARSETAAGGTSLLLTGDRDLFQCADAGVVVLYLKTGIKGVEEVDAAEVERRYGIPPDLVPDFIALRGDPSDGLPGARGIGEKTARDLLRRHGSLEGVLAAGAAAGQEPPRVRAVLREDADLLRAFRDIAELREPAVERPEDGATDLSGGARAARERAMRRLAERLEAAGDVAAL